MSKLRAARMSAGVGSLATWFALGGVVSALAAEPGGSVKAAEPPRCSKAVWESIAPLFSPPAEFAGDFGEYRSPLVFNDGRKVASAADWARRRQEIRDTWQALMGVWPPIDEQPKVEILETERREDFQQYRVRFDYMPDRPVEAHLLVPDGQGRRPAALVVYYDSETSIGLGKPMRDFAYQLTKRGFVTLSVGNRAATEAKTYGLFWPSQENARLQPLSAFARAAAQAYHVLAQRADVDPARVGVLGHSFGGKWALFAGCLYDKFACVAVSDPGIVFDPNHVSVNYWEPWYLGYEPGQWRKRGLITADNPCHGLYARLVAEGHDLHELHALLAPRPFFVSGGACDQPRQWRALNHLVQVNRLLGYENRVAMSNREKHEPTAESNEQIYRFFEYFLKPVPEPSAPHGAGPRQ